ncbi:MAG: acyl-CoA dehydrogenase family protein, partial [Deltaproteobacteria bacterium]|nr:acyl-CoA dehydrogenase family protein [Deltaproteobacteria bacterium]
MACPELDLNLSAEQKTLRDMVRRFAVEVVRPIGIELDKMADPADVIADGSPLWDAQRQFRELGLHTRALPKAVGGMLEDMDTVSGILVGEEMSYADAGLTTCLGGGAATFRIASMSPDSELQGWARDFCKDTTGKIV